MRVFFLHPPFKDYFSRSARSPQVSRSGTLYYPVWLALAAAYVEKRGHEIGFLDAVADRVPEPEVIGRLARFGPDVVVLETSTPSVKADGAFAEKVKAGLPSVRIIVVGTHPAAVPEETLEDMPAVDAACCSEYETPVAEYCAELQKGGDGSAARGLVVRTAGGLRRTPAAPLIANLDDIPSPVGVYKRFLTPEHYYFAAAGYPGVMLMTGRGCPNRCSWCVLPQTMHGRRYRHFSPERVVADIEEVCEVFPQCKELWLDDDTFTADRKHVHRVCELLIEKKLRFARGPLKWYCNARPPLDLETMRLMRRAGCRLIVVGFESGDPDILKAMHKGFTIEQGHEVMRNSRLAGLLVHGCFVVGNPGETRESMERTLRYAIDLNPDSAQFYFINPYPGTEYFQWAVDNGCLLERDYSRWLDENGALRCVLNLPGMDAGEMTEFCRNAFRRYHFRPRYVAGKLLQLFTRPSEGWRSLKSAIRAFM